MVHSKFITITFSLSAVLNHRGWKSNHPSSQSLTDKGSHGTHFWPKGHGQKSLEKYLFSWEDKTLPGPSWSVCLLTGMQQWGWRWSSHLETMTEQTQQRQIEEGRADRAQWLWRLDFLLISCCVTKMNPEHVKLLFSITWGEYNLNNIVTIT